MRGRRHFNLNSIHWIALLELALIFILLDNMLKKKEPVQARKGPDPTHGLRLELEACVNASMVFMGLVFLACQGSDSLTVAS